MGISGRKQKKRTCHWILYIGISLEILAQTDNFDFLEKIYPKTVSMVENEKSEHRH